MSSAATDPIPAGSTKERLSLFTDAVLAVAMVLLVVDIPRPSGTAFSARAGATRADAAGRLAGFLADRAGSFFAYALALVVLWIVWRQHHTAMDRIRHASPAMIGWHLPLLLAVGFLPYATSAFGAYPDNPAAALLFGLTVGALLTCRSIVLSLAIRDRLLLPTVGEAQHRFTSMVSWIVTAYWLASLLLVWWTPWVAFYWVLTPLVGPALSRLLSLERQSPGPADVTAVRTAQ